MRTKKGYETVEFDRGTLTSSTSSSITLTRPDGPTVSATITSGTRVRGVPENKWASSDRVLLVQSGGNALLVFTRPPAAG